MPSFRGVHYTREGEGRAVLLLHGWGGSIDCFASVANDLSGDFTVFRLDFWGFGASEMPPLDADIYSYAEVVEDFINKVIASPVILLGHSFGGRVAIILGAACPLVEKIVLIDSAGLRPRQSLKKRIKIARYHRLKKKVNAGRIEPSKLDTFGSRDYLALPTALRQVFVRVVNEDLSYLARKIKVPTLLVWGRRDSETPLYMARKLRKMILHSTLQVLNGGHFAYLECEREFLRICYEFMHTTLFFSSSPN